MIEGLATWTLDQALDPASRDGPPVASRCGAIRTSAVSARTTLLVARFRYHLQSAASAEEGPVLCEEIAPLACTGSADAPCWLSPEESERLLAARPEGNLLLTAIEQQLGLLLPALPELRAALEAVAHERAEPSSAPTGGCAPPRERGGGWTSSRCCRWTSSAPTSSCLRCRGSTDVARPNQEFQTVRSEGGLLPPDLLQRVLDPRAALAGTRPEDYGLSPGERLNEAITHSWNRLRRHYGGFTAAAANLPEGEAGTGLTNDKWSLPLLREFGFGFLPVSAGPAIGGRAYAIGRFFGPVAVHLVGRGLSLDRRAAGQRGAAAANPHGLVQEFLNRSDTHLWAIVSNGLRLRILRDSQTLSRQSYLEFDLESMFAGEVYSDFVLVWLIAHATRFAPRGDDRPETCWLEQWTREAERDGTRALGELRGGVERALQVLGRGFTSHPRNTALRDALRSGDLTAADLHGQLLRIVYRLIFLFVAEDRTLDGESLLHPPDDSGDGRAAREVYATHYGTARLRALAGRIRGSRHGDIWQQFRLVVGALSGEPEGEIVRGHLALPALGSFLWSPESTPDLNDAELTNHDFLETLRRLAYTRPHKVLRPVDYRNLGAEELGGVYESLLALTPQVSGDGADFTFAEFAGNARKTSGSYYTPDVLVQSLLDSALDPVVEAVLRGKTGEEAERAILDLKVCDPAVGSGHFLVGAAHRLARHLARVRAHATGESEPSPLLYQHALRDVIGRCLYGVDINPMAAELCRVNLWLEALEPGKPHTFLDHHIRVGNSLLGATPELIEGGLPDESFKPLQGDDRSICSGLRKKNKLERENRLPDWGHLMVAEPRAEYGSLASRSRWLEESPDDTLDEVKRKEARFQGLVVSPPYRQGKRIADAWCAAFVQPRPTGRDPAECITTDTLRGLETDPEALAPTQRNEIERLARDYQFFHWHLAFPEVFDNGGFDCVLGNPPWERVKLQEKEWFAQRSTEIADAPNAAARKRMIRSLKNDDPELHQAYLEALRQSEGWSHLMRRSGRLPLCARGDINSYAVFAETMRYVLNEGGRAGCVLPTGIATDDTTKFFFQDVTETKSLVSLFDFENRRRPLPDIDSRMKFCLFTCGNGEQPAADRAEFAFFAHAIEELDDPERRFTLSPDDISLLNPNTRTCPTFRSRRDAELAKAIYRRVPVLINAGPRTANPRRTRGASGSTGCSTCPTTPISSGPENSSKPTAGSWKATCFAGKRRSTCRSTKQRWSITSTTDGPSYRVEGGKETAIDVSLQDKENPDFTVLPRYWVAAREVRLRTANLPKELLAALRDRNADLIVLAVCHLLFIDRLRQESEGSADTAIHEVFPTWIEFTSSDTLSPGPSRRPRWGCADNSPPCIQPLGPSYLPAEPTRQDQDRPAFEYGLVCRRSPRPVAIVRLSRAVRRTPAFRPTVADWGRSARVCGGTAFPRLSPLADGLARHHQQHQCAHDDCRHHPVCRGRGQILAHVSLYQRSTGSRPIGLPQLVRTRFRRTQKDQWNQPEVLHDEADCSAPSRCLLRCRARIHGSARA